MTSILNWPLLQFDSLVASGEDGVVALFDPITVELTGLVTRANSGLAVRSAQFGNSGKKCAVGSDDLIVKVIDIRDTSKMQQLAGHSKAVRAVSWNPDGSILVSI